MSKDFLNKLYNPTSRSSSMFVTTSEEEFADALKSSGWSDDSIEKELEELRKYKKLFKLETPREELEENSNTDLTESILRIKKKRQ